VIVSILPLAFRAWMEVFVVVVFVVAAVVAKEDGE
jgi:hypothetical protein